MIRSGPVTVRLTSSSPIEVMPAEWYPDIHVALPTSRLCLRCRHHPDGSSFASPPTAITCRSSVDVTQAAQSLKRVGIDHPISAFALGDLAPGRHIGLAQLAQNGTLPGTGPRGPAGTTRPGSRRAAWATCRTLLVRNACRSGAYRWRRGHIQLELQDCQSRN